MKNNQSKTYPQGTRTLWRYLSALILLLTLSIGQMWGTDPVDTYYKFPDTKTSGQTVSPVSGESNDITVGSNGVVASAYTFAGTAYTNGLKLGNTLAKGATLSIPGSTDNPAHVFIVCSGSNKDIYLELNSTKEATGNVYTSVTTAPGVVELVVTKSGNYNLYASGDVFCYEIIILYEKNTNIVKTYLSGADMAITSSSEWDSETEELLYFKPMEVTVDKTNKRYTFSGTATAPSRRTITFTAKANGSLLVGAMCSNNSNRNLMLKELSSGSFSDALVTSSNIQKGATTTLEYASISKGKTYVLVASGSDMHVTSIEFTASSSGDCTSPEIEWGTEPAGGEVDDDDFAASVTTTPAEQSVTWTSSRTAVATVTNGTIHYVAPGFTKITAAYTYSGSDYCEEEASINTDIVVPITTTATGANDKYWYYTSAVPSGSPDNGLTYTATKTGNGLYGTKLNSDGYAWFAKPAVAGTLRVGAYYSSSSSSSYVVDVYACSSTGTKGDKIGSLTTPHVGGVSSTLDIDEDVEGIYIVRNTNSEGVLYFVEFKDATPSCDATAPGDIEKGEASGGTGKITLKVEDDGEPVTGDAWYWQSAANGEAKTEEYDAEDGKEVSATGTYYLRSYNSAGDCWSAAKNVTVEDADLLTAISPTLSYSANIIVGNTASPTLNGNDGSGSVTYALNDVTPAGSLTINTSTGVVTAVTAGGTATVTATIAANGNYAAGAATSGTITAVANPLGTHTLTWTMAVGKGDNNRSNLASSVASTSTYVTATQEPTVGSSAAKVTEKGASDRTIKVTGDNEGTSRGENSYVEFAFSIADGYQFTPSAVSVKVANVTTAKNYDLVLSDGSSNKEYTFASEGTDGSVETASWSSITGLDLTGDCKLRVYGYYASGTDGHRFGTPITITGTVAAYVPKYDLTFAAGTGASGSMSTLKYAEGANVTLPACTFTAPTGKEFDAWVVTKTVGGASVTVTDGAFTMPAEAVTATATWKDRPKHTDATLSDLTVGGTTVDDFDAATTSYNVELPFGTFAAPTVAATATDAEYVESVVVTQATSTSGDATVVVTAEDGETTKTYTVHFSVVASKDIELVWATDKQRCDATTPSAKALIATASTYLSASYTGSAAEGSSLTTNKTTGSKIIITAKPGYAFKAMGFYGKIEDGTCKFYNDGVVETIGTSTGDACYSDVFSNDEVHEFIFELTGTKGIYIRNMQLTMIQACTPKTIAWEEEPVEYEVGATGLAIAASANNGTITYASSDGDVIAVNESTGALTLKALGTVTLSASVPAGDGVIYCDEGAQVSKANVETYYLVTFDKQNETAVSTVKYYYGDEAIALPSPSYSGYVFQGWFDAAEGGNQITEAITPSASRTVYAQWVAQCAGPTITAQPANASYFTGRTASALSCTATPGVEGKALTYTWYSCDDAERTNSVVLAGAPTPSTAAASTQYYYCAVTEEDCDVIRNSNVATITVTDKDKARIIKATLKGGTTAPDVEGYLAGSATANTHGYNSTYDGYKFGSNGHYVSLTLADGEEFQTGDVVNIYVGGVEDGVPASKVYFATAANNDNVVATIEQNLNQGNNYINLPAALNGEQTFFLYRKDSKMNPYAKYAEVYRPYPVPVLTAMTVNGSAATISGTNVTATIASNAELTSLTIVPTFMSNDPTQTNGALGGPWVDNEGVYTNSYVVTDKDGDSNTYTITLTRDVEIASVTISGETSVAAESQITLTATVLPNNVINKAVTWSSSDETKAVVDANGVVTGKAAGSVTITATAVADNTKYGTYDITVTPFIGTKYAYWFTKTGDIPEDLANDNGTIFEGAPSFGSSANASMTVEINGVERTFDVTARSGDVSFGTFHVPAGFTADLYVLAIGSGSPRTLKLQETTTSAVYKSTPEEFGNEAVKLVFSNVAAGNYTFDKGGQNSRVFMMVAELNSYPLSAISLADMTLRTEQSATPAMTLTHAKAAITSQTWSIIENHAEGTTINATTGVITAGTTPGTITVQVVAEDAMGNEVTSNICTVTVVNIFERENVTGSMTWNWNGAGAANVSVATDHGLALANYISGDEWRYISGTNGDFAYNTNNSGSYQGTGSLSFYTTVPGLVKISGKRISYNAVISINGTVTAGTLGESVATLNAICVAPGEITITPDANGMRITKIEFDANLVPSEAEESTLGGYERTISEGVLGTICLPNGGVMVGASVFEVAYMDYEADGTTPHKIYFDEVVGGVMEAGIPYVILANEGSSQLGVYYTDAANESAQSKNGLVGYMGEGRSLVENEWFIYDNKFYYVSAADAASGRIHMGNNRAYLDITNIPGYTAIMTPAPGRRRVSLGNGSPKVATGIEDLNAGEQPVKVMINGQLYILRGEKMYDATGRLVK